VIHPPVSLSDFDIRAESGDYYLCAGQLVGYKRVDLAVRAFTRMGKKLVVIGDGGELARLQRIAGPTIEFKGRASLEELQHHFSTCRALVFPGKEDFGIVPLEVMAAGRPVIAFGEGGALETVAEGVTGVFFKEQTEDAVVEAVERFEQNEVLFADREAIRAHAQRFSTESFKAKISDFIEAQLATAGVPHVRQVGGRPVTATMESVKDTA